MSQRRRQCARSRGFTLIELLVVVATLAVLLNVLMLMFTTASRLSAYNSQALNRLSATAELGDEFAELVRRSAGVADGVGQYKNDEDTLVLRMPAESGAERYAILGALRQPRRLSRMDLTVAHGETTISYFRTFAMPVEHIAFRAAGRQITLEALPPENLRRGQETPLVFAATPRSTLEARP